MRRRDSLSWPTPPSATSSRERSLPRESAKMATILSVLRHRIDAINPSGSTTSLALVRFSPTSFASFGFSNPKRKNHFARMNPTVHLSPSTWLRTDCSLPDAPIRGMLMHSQSKRSAASEGSGHLPFRSLVSCVRRSSPAGREDTFPDLSVRSQSKTATAP